MNNMNTTINTSAFEPTTFCYSFKAWCYLKEDEAKLNASIVDEMNQSVQTTWDKFCKKHNVTVIVDGEQKQAIEQIGYSIIADPYYKSGYVTIWAHIAFRYNADATHLKNEYKDSLQIVSK
ncbi:hypothetical protein [Aeromonas caviae]|uniref:hypothetical protein n=1 Tax=Aeromonas caviae TaxID=648 RepID=UPI00225A1547|nr:hypothetical protein [Aeromonas caviae]MCX4071919.1 hypothetical protein [Aeromonas caviae]